MGYDPLQDFGWDKGGTIADEIETGRKPDTSLPDTDWDKNPDTTGGFGW
jgi:hypothetical protein